MEIADTADHCGTGNQMIAVDEETLHHRLVANVGFHETETRVVIVHSMNATVFRKVVDTDHFVATLEQLRDDVSADKA
jgi:hypothetical protein